ncbi:unnamed protein product [Soboliphyme baturini]|uniref:CCHC-type domain-containing protein n=1 Tax=Soboliphyme baturini TaxID=241478 RepID=A0A183J7E2_9BILA|nr:unnamed protein product [Soboliphyme baturini]
MWGDPDCSPCPSDDDSVDSELEAALYACVYHAPQDIEQQQDGADKSWEDASTVDLVSDSERSVQILDSSGDESVVCCSSSSSDMSLDMSNLQGYSPNLNTYSPNVSCTDFKFDETASPLLTMSVPQILSLLPDDPNLWRIDLRDKMGSRYRYYDSNDRSKFGNRIHYDRFIRRLRAFDLDVGCVCYICGSSSHTGRFCPDKACLICFSFGHFTDDCPISKKALCQFRCKRCKILGHEDTVCL